MELFQRGLLQSAFFFLIIGSTGIQSGPAHAQGFNYVQFQCEGLPYAEDITVGVGSSTGNCSNAASNQFGNFTSDTAAIANFGSGSWSVGVTWNQVNASGVGAGPVDYVLLGATDGFTFAGIPPDAIVLFTGSVSRTFSILAPTGGSASADFLFGVTIQNRTRGTEHTCSLTDSGVCMTMLPFSSGEIISFSWGVRNLVAVSGTLPDTFGYAFDPAAFDLAPLEFFDSAGIPIGGVVVQSESGTLYPVASIPEPKSWLLLLIGALFLLRNRMPQIKGLSGQQPSWREVRNG